MMPEVNIHHTNKLIVIYAQLTVHCYGFPISLFNARLISFQGIFVFIVSFVVHLLNSNILICAAENSKYFLKNET